MPSSNQPVHAAQKPTICWRVSLVISNGAQRYARNAPSSHGGRSGQHHEASDREVFIQRQRVADAALLHHNEAHRVGEREALIVITLYPLLERFILELLGAHHDLIGTSPCCV